MTDRRYWPLVLMILLFLASSLLPVGAAGAAEKVPPGRCTAVGLDEAAAILGVPARDLVPSIGEVPVSPDDRQRETYRVPPYICRVRSKANLLKNISYTVYVYRDPALARSKFDTLGGNFATVAKVVPVSGLGERAFLVDDQRFHRLVALKGPVMVDIAAPHDPEQQKKIMRLVLQAF